MCASLKPIKTCGRTKNVRARVSKSDRRTLVHHATAFRRQNRAARGLKGRLHVEQIADFRSATSLRENTPDVRG